MTNITTTTFDSLGVTSSTIVHEATHAVIDADHFNQVVTTGTHEAAAYIAETVFALATNEKGHTLDVSGLRKPLRRIAERIRAFCAKDSGVCPISTAKTQQIKLIIGNSALRAPIDHEETMDGIPTDNQTGGLLRPM